MMLPKNPIPVMALDVMAGGMRCTSQAIASCSYFFRRFVLALSLKTDLINSVGVRDLFVFLFVVFSIFIGLVAGFLY
jgi:hypothetical protein